VEEPWIVLEPWHNPEPHGVTCAADPPLIPDVTFRSETLLVSNGAIASPIAASRSL
jgi:hypothetical protein